MKTRFLLIPLLLSFSFSATATTVKSYLYNREGIQKLKDKSSRQAYQSFLKALEEDPMNPGVHLNLAFMFEINEEFEKAEKAYKSALEFFPTPSEPRFQTLFNLAGVEGKLGKIDEALAHYQQALEIEPDSLEVKTNIELLWQQGQGGGKGKNQQQKDQKENKDQSQNQDKQDQKGEPEQKKKQQPKPFDSQELTKEDVKKILDEIKNQEQGIRAQENDRGAKDAPRSKDW